MSFTRLPAGRIAFGLCAVCLCLSAFGAATNQVVVLEKEGQVEAARANENRWLAAQTNQVLHVADRIRTGERSRATLHLLDLSTMRMAELTEFLIEPSLDAPDKPSFSLGKGLLYFFHRDKPADVQFKTRTATAAIRGTEFHLAVADNGRTVITMFDGEVRLSNEFGAVELGNGEQGVVEPGQAPVKSPALDAISTIQWCLYYPGVLAVDELKLDTNEASALQSSLTAYRAGDLRSALTEYPAGRQPASEAEKTYLAALLLSVGKVDEAGPLLTNESALPAALRALISTVQKIPGTNTTLISTNTATESLVRSYQLQAQSRLPEALDSAKQSVALAPQFGFGWARVAELEFSFGHTKQAMAAGEQSLAISPRNAQAVTMRGFALAAQNRIREASVEFDRAIALDGALGNAWLGRGLCRIRRGQLAEGRADLQVAATLEPNRALLRSYLAKAWTELGQTTRAEREVALAKERDANDPTAWLYSALLLQQENRINEAVDDLERSQDLNDNRRLYRSRLLLDQDRAVRGANLANIYRDAGMTDVSIREAATAVNADYANHSAHNFLSDSYTALRDPYQVNLRYETPAVAEHLIANLLSPVSASPLSRVVSQQEYSQLFERDRMRLALDSQYFSSGAWSLNGAIFGTMDNTAYAVEGAYVRDPGQRPNADFEERDFAARIHQRLSERDTLYIEATDSIRRSGDVTPYYNDADANPTIRIKDAVEPTVVAGWHRAWSPESHTLLLASYLHSDLFVDGGNVASLALGTNSGGVFAALPIFFTQDYHGQLNIFSGEVQQIFEAGRHTTIVGLMGQSGSFHTMNSQDFPDIYSFLFTTLPVTQEITADFNRVKAYGYHRWALSDAFRVDLGLSGDWVSFPANHRSTPLSEGTDSASRWSPKAGVVWEPNPGTRIRAAYALSLAGTSFDQSFQLEPTEVAGFNQSFRSLIPEALAGANSGAYLDMAGLSVEHRLTPSTYLSLSLERLASRVNRDVGAFVVSDDPADVFHFWQTPQHLDFVEESLQANAHQMLGARWTLNVSYRLTHARLDQVFPEIPPASVADPSISAQSRTEAVMQSARLGIVYNHPNGFFSGLEAQWLHQSNRADSSALGDSDFWQGNAFAGWRFWQRRAEVSVGVLNVTDQDYHLNPVNYVVAPARERTFMARFRLTL